MKTLQQEIVEALNDGGDSAISCQIDFKLFNRLKKLSAKVESARCENCEYWAKEGSFQLRLCAIHDEDRQFKDFCWNFKRKVE